ncbi:hypothetical protein HK099_007146 [Clydaea vesicula]|uniref:F-box domain-containing protein n=1 Tax=Clydaea vesicula TaxID=447962 RepID=A0AAD5Y0P0_9FUNG|nr:hypothetical protein HK099_007146 [Clydaea vesicula]KAJ3394242.1 hypothetical protein HDU92_007101 [Lobulomyces angularis]
MEINKIIDLNKQKENIMQDILTKFDELDEIYQLKTLKTILQSLKTSMHMLSEISRTTVELQKINFVELLPTNVSVRIFGYLDHKSLCRATQLSKQWSTLCNDDSIWYRMCIQHIDKQCTKCGLCLPLLNRKRKRAELNAENVLKFNTSSNGKYLMPWKKVFSERQQIESNWRAKRFFQKTLSGHNLPITCMKLDNNTNTLISGSEDTTIRIWDLNHWSLVKVLTGHTDTVTCLQFDVSKLVSGSLDSTLRIWSLDKMECVKIFNHANKITSLHFLEKILVSGSEDCSISVANLQTGRCFKLSGHTAAVSTVQIIENSRLISASKDQTLKIWCLESQQVLLNIDATKSVTNFYYTDSKLLTTSKFERILKIFDISTGHQKNAIEFEGKIFDFCIDKLRILLLMEGSISVYRVGNYERVWDIDDNGSNCCLLSDDKVVCGVKDVVIYDFGVFSS